MILMVDDERDLLEIAETLHQERDNIVFEVCTSAEEVMQAIEKHRPDTLYLDHALTKGGREGLEVVERLEQSKLGEGLTIYSTSEGMNQATLDEYRSRGIHHLEKSEILGATMPHDRVA